MGGDAAPIEGAPVALTEAGIVLGHVELHGPGAGQRGTRRSPGGHLLVRRDAVRNGDRRPALPRRQHRGRHPPAVLRHRSPARRADARRAGRARSDRRPRDGQAGRRSLLEHAGARQRFARAARHASTPSKRRPRRRRPPTGHRRRGGRRPAHAKPDRARACRVRRQPAASGRRSRCCRSRACPRTRKMDTSPAASPRS